MDMLDVYSHKELQSFIAFLTHCEAEGITDVRIARERVARRIEQQARSTRAAKVQEARRIRKEAAKINETKYPICPSCGRGRLVPTCKAQEVEGLRRRGCKECYYSEIVES